MQDTAAKGQVSKIYDSGEQIEKNNPFKNTCGRYHGTGTPLNLFIGFFDHICQLPEFSFKILPVFISAARQGD